MNKKDLTRLAIVQLLDTMEEAANNYLDLNNNDEELLDPVMILAAILNEIDQVVQEQIAGLEFENITGLDSKDLLEKEIESFMNEQDNIINLKKKKEDLN